MKTSSVLSEDYSGFESCDYRYIFDDAIKALEGKTGRANWRSRVRLKQLRESIEDLAKRWYAGDELAIDQFFQQYKVERSLREAVHASQQRMAPARHQSLASLEPKFLVRMAEIGLGFAFDVAHVEPNDLVDIATAAGRSGARVTMIGLAEQPLNLVLKVGQVAQGTVTAS